MDPDSELELLFEDYASKLPSRVAAIQNVWRRYQGRPDEPTLATLHHLCHQLAGSSGSYGYAALYGATKTLAELLLGARDPLSSEEKLRVDALIRDLDTLITEPGKLLSGTTALTTAGNATGHSAGRVCVHLVDDDPGQLDEMTTRLGAAGFLVEGFSDLNAFSRVCNERLADLVVMDLMHGTDADAGLDSIRRISNRFDEFPPVVFVSARGDFAARMAAVQLGAASYLVKPLDYNLLVSTLNGLIGPIDAMSCRVLLIEDDADQATLYQKLLREEGFDVAVLEDPLGIPKELEQFDPDLILLDYLMPGFNGEDIARLIRLDDQWSRIPIVFLSAESVEDRQIAALRAGGDVCLPKSMASERLVSEVRLRAERAKWWNHISRGRSREISLAGELKAAVDQHCLFARLDDDCLVVEANQHFRDWLATVDISPTGIDLLEGACLESSQDSPEQIRQTISKGEVWQGVLGLKGNEAAKMLTSIVPSFDQFGRPRRYLWISTALTYHDPS